MGHNNGIITETKINTADVAAVLGAATNDVGSLCVHPNINMFSKYKPTRYASFGPDISSTDTEEQKLEKIRAFKSVQYRAGAKDNCGISIVPFSNLSNAIAAMDGRENGWKYERPTGSASSPYRLVDFSLYCHTASPPLTGFSCNAETYEKKIQISGALNRVSGSTLSLGLQDIGTISDYSIYIRIEDSQGHVSEIDSGSTGDTFDVTIDLSGHASLVSGICTALPYLKNRSGQVILFPYVDFVSFKYITTSEVFRYDWSSISVDATKQSISFTLKITNNTSSAFSNMSGYIAVISPSNYAKGEYGNIVGNAHKSLSDISISANDTKSFNEVFSNLTVSGFTRCWDELEEVSSGKVYIGFYLRIQLVAAIGSVVYSNDTYERVYVRDATSSDNVGSGSRPGRT